MEAETAGALREFLRRFRYRDIPELLGTTFEVADPDDFSRVFSGRVRGFDAELESPRSREGLLGALIKYGIVDAALRCKPEALLGHGSRGGRRAFRELSPIEQRGEGDQGGPHGGWPISRKEEAKWLLEDMVPHALLRVWMVAEEWDAREIRDKVRAFLEFGRSAKVPEGLFPVRLTIHDACMTNLRSAWLCKHFYM